MSRVHSQKGGHNEGSITDELKETAAHVVRDVKDRASEYIETGKEKAREYVESGRDKAREYVESGREKAREWEEGVEGYIQEKPVQALLIAAGVGLVLGLLWRRH